MDYKSPYEEQSSQFDNFELHVNAEAQGFLRETAKWATFLSILGFIWLGLMVLFSVFFMAMGESITRAQSMSGTPSPVSGAAMGIIYLLVALLYFFPLLYLNRFASKMKNALDTNRTDTLTEAFENIKSHYKFVGILAIIGLALFVLFIVFGLILGIGAAAGAL